MRQTYNEQLEKLNERFMKMGKSVEEAIENGVGAYLNQDYELAAKVVDNDQKINEQEMVLEKKSFELIALQQPVSADLRLIVTVLKASSDLERIGDHAVSIARYLLRQKKVTRDVAIEKLIAEIGIKSQKMVDDVLNAFVKADQKEAIKISHRDYDINKFSGLIYKKCIKNMKKDSDVIIADVNYMLIANTIERIGDYVSNICEWIVYLVDGKLIDLDNDDLA